MDAKQVVLVTGASTGFGRLISETLAHNGHTVFATMRDPAGRNAGNATELRSLAQKEMLPLHPLELDVTDDASINRAVDSILDQSGRIDVAINNAGFGIVGLSEAVTTEQAQKLMDTNFFGPVRVNRAVLPHIRRQHSGLLLHVSSGAGKIVIPSMGFYCATKFALEAMAEAYHYELAGQGIDSVIIQPGAYQTPIFGNIVNAADELRTQTYGPANQLPAKINGALAASAGNPQEVADAVLRIIETPAGQRQLRYRISPNNIGIDEINALSTTVQSRFLEAMGLTDLTTFVQHKTASTS